MASIKTYANGSIGESSLDEAMFGQRLRPAVLREAVEMYEANMRQGTVNTLSRRFVNGSRKKILNQKGSGRARHGDKKAPSFRGGGVAHGPHPRDYGWSMPRKALRRALQVALSGKLRDGQVSHWEGTPLGGVSTKQAHTALKALGAEGSALIVSAGPVSREMLLSIRNMQRVKALPASDISAYDVCFHRQMVLLDGALDVLLARLGLTDAPAPAAAQEGGEA